jgi:hypothetical protein
VFGDHVRRSPNVSDFYLIDYLRKIVGIFAYSVDLVVRSAQDLYMNRSPLFCCIDVINAQTLIKFANNKGVVADIMLVDLE